MLSRSPFETLLRRDREVVLAALATIILGSWTYLLIGAGMDQHEMGGATMAMMRPTWSPAYFALMAVMWSIMMAAMMLPSAAPMLLFHAAISRRRAEETATLTMSVWFALGYLAIWGLFSLAATVLEWTLARAALLSPMMELSSRALAASVLVAAGAYQWTPLKQSCLRKCRSPLDFVIAHWRDGRRGSFVMGLRHGRYCLGCCWLLMLLLFVGGVMNLAWIAGLAAFVLVEKLAPAGHWAGRLAGLLLVAWGAVNFFELAG